MCEMCWTMICGGLGIGLATLVVTFVGWAWRFTVEAKNWP